jgi:nitroreductase
MMDALTALVTRASAVALTDPAPDEAALERMLEAAMAAPDHGRLRPWRFIAVRGEARAKLGQLLAETLRAREPQAPDALIEKEKGKALRAPLILVAAAHLTDSLKVPAIEQVVAVGAAAQNVMLAAHALGYGAMWKTGAPAYDPRVKTALGLEEGDQIVGFLYLGTAAGPTPGPRRAQPRSSFTEWSGPAG